MARKIIWTPRAQSDRKSILTYWTERNQSRAYSIKLNKLFEEAAVLLKTHPDVGTATGRKDVRAKVVKDYLVVYRVAEDTIFILIIWDTRRDPEEFPKV